MATYPDWRATVWGPIRRTAPIVTGAANIYMEPEKKPDAKTLALRELGFVAMLRGAARRAKRLREKRR